MARKKKEELPDWPRTHYREPGGRPFLFFVVYGQFGEMPALSSSKYRSNGLPDGLDLSHYNQESNPDVLAGPREIASLWEQFQADDRSLANEVAESTECLLLRGELEDVPNLNYLRDVVGMLTFLLDHGGIAIFDPQRLQWWSPTEWRRQIFDPASPSATQHVVILASPEIDRSVSWFHTRGMRKFGRPDLSIHNVGKHHQEAIIDLLNRFIEFQAFGGVIDEKQKIKVRGLPKGMTCTHRGNLDDPEFNNVHVEITFHDG